MSDPLTLLWIGAGFAVGVILTMVGARVVGRNITSKARRDAAQTVSDAEREAASIIKDAKTSIKEQQIELRAQIEKEAREQRREIVALEKRILAKEEVVDKRVEAMENKSEDIAAKERELKGRETELADGKHRLDELVQQQTERLESVSGMSADEAKRELFTQLETEVRRDTAMRLKRIEDELVESSEKKARWIIGQAIQRCAADHVVESSVSVVNLPSDEMKGRIIGREGRNIRALESATGINVIIDDTPEAVILSGFDPRAARSRADYARTPDPGWAYPSCPD